MSMTEKFDVPGSWDDVPRVNGFGIASLVLGTFAVAVAFIPVLGLPALVLGPLAMVFGGIGRARKPADTITGTAGLILGIVGTLIALAVTVLVVLSYGRISGTLQNLPFNTVQQAAAVTGSGTAVQAQPPAVPDAAALPESGCHYPDEPKAGNIREISFYADGSTGDPLQIDYGSAYQPGCVEGVTASWV